MAASVTIDDALEARVRQLAKRHRRSEEGLMREAIEDFVRRGEARDDFLREAREAEAEFRATGHHLTSEDVDRWLSGWGTEEETDPPACHG
ncbi:CopG family ribbon-helix-helix protein [Antarcticirhabdus aurantiaca]|uniref:CopG family transcriptional regulator n=1 Tax=Antarcticirhabdus aurantiaca TaxID=2606717 RepID=A0ACD4NP68_9HYPH|nr:CopG family transcriptional regulator [Jeongeuplla avenae]